MRILSVKKHLFVGFGDIASRCAEKLIANGEHVVGIARSSRMLPVGVEFWQGDITHGDLLKCVAEQRFSNVVITLTPDGRDADAYRRTYLHSVQGLIAAWQKSNPPDRIVYVSSTRVYGQQNGEWVDENSPTEPGSEAGEILCEAEAAILNSGLNGLVVRFSGIYGPGRDSLIRQVKSGKAGDEHFTNRIHIDDCCGVILFLLRQPNTADLPRVLLASDNTPVKSSIIRAWLAGQLGITLNTAAEPQRHDPPIQQPKSRAGNKRCNNARLLALGYDLKYPSYRDGYVEMLDTKTKAQRVE